MGEEEWAGIPEGEDSTKEEGAFDAEMPPQIDLNTATAEELRQLPGIGDALAARIVDYRAEAGPFGDPAEITAVRGVSEAMYSRLADWLIAGAVEPALAPEQETPEEVPVLEMGPRTEEAADWVVPVPGPADMEAEPEGEAVAAETLEPEELERAVGAPPRGPEPPLVEVVQARVGCGRLVLVGLLSALLGAVLALALIFLVNGTLDFQSAAIRTAQDEVLRMEGVVGALNVKIAELEERLGAIQELDARLSETQAGLRRLSAELDAVRGEAESLAERQGALRQEFTTMREDLDGLAGHVSLLDRRLSEAENQIASLSGALEILGESILRFDAFLTGLQELLNESSGVLEPTPTLWITPMNTPESTAAPATTAVPRPQVTVIPLATPTERP